MRQVLGAKRNVLVAVRVTVSSCQLLVLLSPRHLRSIGQETCLLNERAKGSRTVKVVEEVRKEHVLARVMLAAPSEQSLCPSKTPGLRGIPRQMAQSVGCLRLTRPSQTAARRDH